MTDDRITRFTIFDKQAYDNYQRVGLWGHEDFGSKGFGREGHGVHENRRWESERIWQGRNKCIGLRAVRMIVAKLELMIWETHGNFSDEQTLNRGR